VRKDLQAWFRVCGDARDFGTAHASVYRNYPGADFRTGQRDSDKRGAVFGDQEHPVTGGNTVFPQQIAPSRNGVTQIAVTQLSAVAIDHRRSW